MMYGAYVLIELNISVDFPVTLAAIRGVPGVKQAHLVVGPTDCIAYIEVNDQQKSIETVKAIRAIVGVEKTDSRPVADI